MVHFRFARNTGMTFYCQPEGRSCSEKELFLGIARSVLSIEGLSHIGNVRSAISTTRYNSLRLAPPAA